MSQNIASHSEELIQFFSERNIYLKYIESTSTSIVSQLVYNSKTQQKKSNALTVVVKEVLHQDKESFHQHTEQCYNLENEVQKLNNLSHKYIISLVRNNITKLKHSCLIFLPQARCDLFDLMIKSYFPSIPIIKQCFRQVAEALNYLHNEKNIIHGDLKPENIFVFDDFTFKLADFGFSYFPETFVSRQQFIIKYYNRTLKFLPPEFSDCFENRNYNMSLINEYNMDIFGFGVSLFCIIFDNIPCDTSKQYFCQSHEPFEFGIKQKYYHRQDQLYKWLYSQKKEYQQIFWQQWQEKCRYEIPDMPYLQDLLIKCITPYPQQRIKIEDILNHPWLNTIN